MLLVFIPKYKASLESLGLRFRALLTESTREVRFERVESGTL
jgi:hypothetical protein